MKGEIQPEDFGIVDQTIGSVASNAATNLVDARDSDDEDENLHEVEQDHAALYEISGEGIATAQLDEEERGALKEAADNLKEALENLETETKVSQSVLNETDIWRLCQEDRELLFKYWLELKVQTLGLVIKSYADKYLAKSKELEAISSEVDLFYLKSAAIIGMTTTGAAKNAKLLRKLEPRVIIVEEAAEVLEAHIIASLSDHVEHLIMIGDHEQLRPSNAVFYLATLYNLNLSLFERLIENKVKHITLDCQHRMRPEISNIMKIIYPELTDHNVVKKLERIQGLTTNLYFITHEHLEDELIEDTTSRSNIHEAKFVVKLALYLMKQGYEQKQITLLTFYNGQKYLLKDLLTKEKGEFDFTITTVDKYQGEENDIVILSVVRGNKENFIGHCCVDNRVCVAFSRAKKGFFIIGNMNRLRIASKKTKSDRWNKILDRLGKEKCIGPSLPLCCERHDQAVTKVATGEDFAKVKDGGCSLKCETILPCTHQCPLLCHPGEHINIECEQTCQKFLPCSHRCPGKCAQDCSSFKCRVTIEKQAPCGHMITGACSLTESEFFEKPCTFKCTIILLCGHSCVGNCDVCVQGSHTPCTEKCPKKLICGHSCQYECHFPSQCPPCAEPCSRSCAHSKCPSVCGDVCVPCTEVCDSTCEHISLSRKCNEISNLPICNKKCTLKLECGHGCIGLCGYSHPPVCRVCDPDNEIFQIYFGEEREENSTFISLPNCGHIFELNGLGNHFKASVENNPLSLLCCPRCDVEISTCNRFHEMTINIKSEIDKNKVEIAEQTREKLMIKYNSLKPLLTANAFNAILVELANKLPVFLRQIRLSNSYKLYILDEILNILISISSKEYTSELWSEDSPLTRLILNDSLNCFFNDQCPYNPTQDGLNLSELKILYRKCPIYAMFELTNRDSLSSKLRGVFNNLRYKFGTINLFPTPESVLNQCEAFLSKIRGKYDFPLPKSCLLYKQIVKLNPVLSKSKDVVDEKVDILESASEKKGIETQDDIFQESIVTINPKITLIKPPTDCISGSKSEDEWVDD